MQERSAQPVILVVEDADSTAALLGEVLATELDCRPLVVRDGQQALALVHAVQVSLILLDVRLPGLTGWQVYDALRADPATRTLPVIFMTAHPDPAAFAQRGITDVLAKPFDLADLLARVAAVCRPAGEPSAAEPGAAAGPPDPIDYYLALAG